MNVKRLFSKTLLMGYPLQWTLNKTNSKKRSCDGGAVGV